MTMARVASTAPDGQGLAEGVSRDGTRVQRLWGLYSVVTTAVVVAILLQEGGAASARSWVAAVCVLMPTMVFEVLGRSPWGSEAQGSRAQGSGELAGGSSWGGWVQAGVTVAAFLLAQWSDPRSVAMLLVVIPQLFIALRFLESMAVVVVLAVALPVLNLIGGMPWSTIRSSVVTAVLVIVISAAFGRPIDVIAENNKEYRRLLARVEVQQREITRLSHEEGVLEERGRVAREMHDTITQGLASIVSLGHATLGDLEDDPELAREHLTMMRDLAQENLAESRRLIAALAPASLEVEGLGGAISRTARRWSADVGIPVAESIAVSLPPLSGAVEVALLRVCQEGLHNVAAHAGASRVQVTLAAGSTGGTGTGTGSTAGDSAGHSGRPGEAQGGVLLRLTDDGCGFDPSSTHRSEDSGYGLEDMRMRMAEVGGVLSIESAPTSGTVLTARIGEIGEVEHP